MVHFSQWCCGEGEGLASNSGYKTVFWVPESSTEGPSCSS